MFFVCLWTHVGKELQDEVQVPSFFFFIYVYGIYKAAETSMKGVSTVPCVSKQAGSHVLRL